MAINNRQPKGNKPARRWLAYSLISLGIILAIIAGSLFWHEKRAESGPPPPLPQLVANPNKALPPNKIAKPSQNTIDNYSVAPDLPEFIAIPPIGVGKTRILALGLTSGGAIAVPTSSYDTGWYDGSAKPGQKGAMFIYGHVAGWNVGGIFYNLHKLVPADKIYITRGDNTVLTYEVVSKKIYPADNVDMNAVLSPIDPNKPGLNLMTCTWNIVNGQSKFLNRQVVFTSLASSS